MKLDVACGINKQKGFKSIDIVPSPEIDFVWDLEKYPWEPIRNNSCEEIYVRHYAERTKDLFRFMDEVWRICEPNAKITIISPYYTSIQAWQNPQHARAISENTWNYFNEQAREQILPGQHQIKSNFDVLKMMIFFNPPWDKKSDEAREFAKQHYWNVVSDMLVELKAIK
ncbi:MAG: hypothetical protein ABSE68_02050 [Minisyncoccia bacterium]